MTFEEEDPPEPTGDDLLALEVAALLRNGNGGIDWTGLPFVCEWFDVREPDMLCRRLRVLLLHKPPPPSGDT